MAEPQPPPWRSGAASLDGRCSALSDATIPVTDRGFLYGDAVFEVLRTWGPRAPTLEEHLARLESSARILGMTLPVPPGRLRAELAELLERTGEGDWYVRLVLSRTTAELGVDPTRMPGRARRMILVAPLRAPAPTLYSKGLTAACLAVARHGGELGLHGAKSASYGESVLAVREARRRGAEEALLLEGGEELLEAATSNVFVVHQGRVRTPAADGRILPGITRARVITAARALGLDVSEGPCGRRELWTADEVFVTSAIREVVAITRIDEHEVGDGRPGTLAGRLHVAYRDGLGLPPGAHSPCQ